MGGLIFVVAREKTGLWYFVSVLLFCKLTVSLQLVICLTAHMCHWSILFDTHTIVHLCGFMGQSRPKLSPKRDL